MRETTSQWSKVVSEAIFPTNCSSKQSIVQWLSSSIFPCLFGRLFVRPAMVTSNQISTFFNIYRHTSLVLTQFHLKPSSTKLYWPSTTKYQPVPPHIDPAPPNTDQNCLLLTQYYDISSSSASYWPNKHHISTRTALCWPSTTKYQPIPPSTGTVPWYVQIFKCQTFLRRPEVSTVVR